MLNIQTHSKYPTTRKCTHKTHPETHKTRIIHPKHARNTPHHLKISIKLSQTHINHAENIQDTQNTLIYSQNSSNTLKTPWYTHKTHPTRPKYTKNIQNTPHHPRIPIKLTQNTLKTSKIHSKHLQLPAKLTQKLKTAKTHPKHPKTHSNTPKTSHNRIHSNHTKTHTEHPTQTQIKDPTHIQTHPKHLKHTK